MIRRVVLKNFQSHRNTEIYFDPYVNTVIGQSDVGKSAILRSLMWFFTGRPFGDSIRTWNVPDKTSVLVLFDDGNCIERIKDNEQTVYIDHKNAQVYKRFGKTVPPEIVEIFNVNDINFSRQMDSPFLLSKSPTEIADYLNSLIDLAIMGKSLTSAKQQATAASNSIYEQERRINECREYVNQYQWVRQANKEFQQLEKQKHNIEKRREQMIDIMPFIEKAKNIDQKLYSIPKFEQKDKTAVEHFIDIIEKHKQVKEDIRKIDILLTKAGRVEKEKVTHCYTPEMQEHFTNLENLQTALNIRKKQLRELLEILEKVKDFFIKIEKNACNLQKNTVVFNKLIGEKCPLCGQIIHKKDKKPSKKTKGDV